VVERLLRLRINPAGYTRIIPGFLLCSRRRLIRSSDSSDIRWQYFGFVDISSMVSRQTLFSFVSAVALGFASPAQGDP